MHSGKYDDLFFASQYVAGLKDEIRATVEPQVPVKVERATLIAKIQQRVLDRGKQKYQKAAPPTRPHQPKSDSKPATNYGNLWRDKQLRDYRKANNLCFLCGEKFEPRYAEVCSKRNKPQVNALIINDLDKTISEDLLNEMAIEEVLTEDFC